MSRFTAEDQELAVAVGTRIRDLRTRAGMTQVKLVRSLPETVDGPTLSRWEKGMSLPSVRSLLMLSEALGVTTDYLLKGQ